MRILPEFFRRVFDQRVFHRTRGLARRKTGAVGDAKDMRVDGNVHLPEHHVQNDTGCLAADTRQGFERFAVRWDLPAVLLDELPAQADEVLCLGVVEPDGLQIDLHAFDAQGENRLRSVCHGKQFACSRVDALVRGVRREHHGNE